MTAGLSRAYFACQASPEPPAGPGPDLTLLTPKLREQWHHSSNQPLGDIQMKSGSQLRVWWTCDQCPCGLPHEWLATVLDRQGMDNQCPFCVNRKLCHHNSLLTVAPSVASYWDTAKNGVTADQCWLALTHAGTGCAQHAVTVGKHWCTGELLTTVPVPSVTTSQRNKPDIRH